VNEGRPRGQDAIEEPPPNTPLKLTAASFGRAGPVLDTHRGSITRGLSLTAIRYATGERCCKNAAWPSTKILRCGSCAVVPMRISASMICAPASMPGLRGADPRRPLHLHEGWRRGDSEPATQGTPGRRRRSGRSWWIAALLPDLFPTPPCVRTRPRFRVECYVRQVYGNCGGCGGASSGRGAKASTGGVFGSPYGPPTTSPRSFLSGGGS